MQMAFVYVRVHVCSTKHCAGSDSCTDMKSGEINIPFFFISCLALTALAPSTIAALYVVFGSRGN